MYFLFKEVSSGLISFLGAETGSKEVSSFEYDTNAYVFASSDILLLFKTILSKNESYYFNKEFSAAN